MSHWMRFCSTCPLPGCMNPTRIIYWTCSYDDSDLYINEDGYIKCGKNGCIRNTHPDFILETKFNCSKHQSYNNTSPGKMGVFNALSFASGKYESDFCFKKILNKILNY